jgi:hypothetical protein
MNALLVEGPPNTTVFVKSMATLVLNFEFGSPMRVAVVKCKKVL